MDLKIQNREKRAVTLDSENPVVCVKKFREFAAKIHKKASTFAVCYSK